MSFPASPTNGQVTTINNITYQWSSTSNTWTRSSPTTGYLSDYIQVVDTTDNTGMTTNSVMVFDTILSGTGIPYNTSTGVFTLTGGKTYELYASLNWATFSDASGGWMAYQWVDATAGTGLIANNGAMALAEPINRNTNETIQPSIKILYTPTTNQTVKLMVTGSSGTATTRGNFGCYATIMQIGGSSLMANVTIGGGAASTSTSTGAVIVNGGLAVQGNINLTGTVNGNATNANYASYSGNVVNASQSNITSVGTLNSLAVSGNVTISGIVTGSGNVNSTAFAVGNGAVGNVALGFFPTAGTAAMMAIRDYSTVNSSVYFDTVIGSNATGGSFQFRGSNAFTQYANINSYGINLPTRPAFRVFGSGGTGISATTTLTSSNFTLDYQQGSALNTSTGVFTAPIAGLYYITLVARIYSTSTVASSIQVNKTSGGTTTTQIYLEWAANTSVNHIGGSTIAKLAVGDTLVLKVTNGNIIFDANDNWAVAYIG